MTNQIWSLKYSIRPQSDHWLERRAHALYAPLPLVADGSAVAGDRSAELAEWLAESAAFVAEMEWLLRMEHFR